MLNAEDAAVASCGNMCEPLEKRAQRWRREISFGCSRKIGTVARDKSAE